MAPHPSLLDRLAGDVALGLGIGGPTIMYGLVAGILSPLPVRATARSRRCVTRRPGSWHDHPDLEQPVLGMGAFGLDLRSARCISDVQYIS